MTNNGQINQRIKKYAAYEADAVLSSFNISEKGMTQEELSKSRNKYGDNQIVKFNKKSFLDCFKRAFFNPFSFILMGLFLITAFTDYLLPQGHIQGKVSAPVIFFLLAASSIIRLYQELKTKYVADQLSLFVNRAVDVFRDGMWCQVPSEELVVGDIVRCRAGDFIAADIRLVRADDFFISQSLITGESNIYKKTAAADTSVKNTLYDYKNIVFMGSTVTGGYGEGVVLTVGTDTVYGEMAVSRADKKRGFDKGTRSIAAVLLKFIIILIPIVFLLGGIIKDKWMESLLFAMSVAVGLVPELLPMVINACLAKGSYYMSKKNTVVKNINAMQSLGSMDILCVDKTGTLTGDKIELEYYMDILGNESQKVLDFAYLNSYFHFGVKNHLDEAVLKYSTYPGKTEYLANLVAVHDKLDEQPFDHDNKMVKVLVRDSGDNKIIIKGSVDEVAAKCSYLEYKGQVVKIEGNIFQNVHNVVDDFYESGMKVLAVAYKNTGKTSLDENEKDFILLGYLGFFDAPKKSAAGAVKKLQQLQIDIRILTGDSKKTTLSVCRRLGIDENSVMTGKELAEVAANEMPVIIEKTKIFAEISPKQKTQIVAYLQDNGHTVGFLGDGMNDLGALLQADVGISVDTAADAAKETADIILLKKDLKVLEQGILIGRESFINMTKYIKITASSNFGNIFSVVIASIFLPFLPMASVQILLLNLLYDILCLSLPWDNVDKELLRKPLQWNGKKLGGFMLQFGFISSVFDIITFLFLYFVLAPQICGGDFYTLDAVDKMKFIAVFQTGWFLESMWTQVLILYLLRTPKLSFAESKPAKGVLLTTLLGVIMFTMGAMTDYGALIGLTNMTAEYYLFLLCTVAGYLICVTFGKVLYCRKNQELL